MNSTASTYKTNKTINTLLEDWKKTYLLPIRKKAYKEAHRKLREAK